MNTPTKPYLNQATPKNTCQNFSTQENPKTENFKSIIPVTENLEYPPLREGIFTFAVGIKRHKLIFFAVVYA